MEERHTELVLEFIKSKDYRPMKLKELCVLFDVPREERSALQSILDRLVSEGKITVDDRGRYRKPEGNDLPGVFSCTQKGFGFVMLESGEEVYIAADDRKDALDKDRVMVHITQEAYGGKRMEGIIVKVLEHANNTVVGTYMSSKNFGFVISDNKRMDKDVYIPAGSSNGAVTGSKVVVSLTDFGSADKSPEGEVVEILGHKDDPGVDILSIVKAMGIPDEYPAEVENELKNIPDELHIPASAGENGTPADPFCAPHLLFEGVDRLDLRSVPTVTIDGEDTKDIDDAVSLSYENGEYTLGVHIADVTNYVKEGSALDKEALKRGTSVYLLDRVIPMLPHKLSNGICSLNEGTDRLALSCIMKIDEKGNVTDHTIANTVIRSDRRMTYTVVNAIISGENSNNASPGEYKKYCEEYSGLVPMFMLFAKLSAILKEKRKKRGAINFDFTESRIILDEKGKPVDILPHERNDATEIIESFMLAANETVAEDFYWQQLPFLYRNHDTPDPDKIRQLSILISNFGYTIKGSEEIHPKEVQKLLNNVSGTPEETLIERLTLRAMKQARYDAECGGHFGLAAKFYTHFTSPIRRYPDLQIHRIIKEQLAGKLNEHRITHYDGILQEVANQASRTERRAEEAERECDKMKKAEYMESRIGEEYDGVVSGVTSWGIYVELYNTIEGMIRLADLTDDYYEFDEERYMVTGERTGRRFELGNKLRVQVVRADSVMRTIDFLPVSGRR